MVTPPPSQAGFTVFMRAQGITTSVLPDDSPVIPMAYAVAIQTVLLSINSVSPLMYTLAVYNLATDRVFNYAQDVGSPPPVYRDELPYFSWWRAHWNINDFIPGVVQSSSDVSTSQSMVIQEAANNFTLSNIQNLKTPYGRQYLSIAQDAGNILDIS